MSSIGKPVPSLRPLPPPPLYHHSYRNVLHCASVPLYCSPNDEGYDAHAGRTVHALALLERDTLMAIVGQLEATLATLKREQEILKAQMAKMVASDGKKMTTMRPSSSRPSVTTSYQHLLPPFPSPLKAATLRLAAGPLNSPWQIGPRRTRFHRLNKPYPYYNKHDDLLPRETLSTNVPRLSLLPLPWPFFKSTLPKPLLSLPTPSQH